ncbi:hypothetical protein MCP1_130111 [Candidatus Terasakiella magnetica]|nr:hypothetical protein MCP1_130111 [Candidatus Terasakiella magnetica]
MIHQLSTAPFDAPRNWSDLAIIMLNTKLLLITLRQQDRVRRVLRAWIPAIARLPLLVCWRGLTSGSWWQSSLPA